MKYTLLKNKTTGIRSIRNNQTNAVVSEQDDPALYAKLRKLAVVSARRREERDIMESFGLTKCIGPVSGKVYWE